MSFLKPFLIPQSANDIDDIERLSESVGVLVHRGEPMSILQGSGAENRIFTGFDIGVSHS